jgi:hypothetical protein
MEDSTIKELRERKVERRVEHGDRVIKLEVHFWTNDIVSDEEKRILKVAWDSGTICILKNEGHGIDRSEPIHFDSLSELQSTIERAFKEKGISLLHSEKYRAVYSP